MSQLLMSYLMGQSELGMDEVILPHPRKFPLIEKIHTQSKTIQPVQTESAPQKSAGSLFAELAKSLESNLRDAQAEVTLQSSPQIPSEVFALPDLENLSEHWKYLSENGRKFFEVTEQSKLSPGLGPLNAPLAVIGYQPSVADGSGMQPFSVEAKALLQKMMKAIRFDLESLYQTSLLKFSELVRTPSRRDFNRILPLLHQELKLAHVPVVLLLGEACAQAVLKTSKSIEELRQIPTRENGRDFVVTYHPDDLLKKEELKRKAWDDLQWLQKRMLEAQADR